LIAKEKITDELRACQARVDKQLTNVLPGNPLFVALGQHVTGHEMEDTLWRYCEAPGRWLNLINESLGRDVYVVRGCTTTVSH
jgi:hypothetical protein